jgi:transcription initiation factor IIE alpha subunit
MSAVGIGAYPPEYRADESFDPTDERLVEGLLFALETLHGEATTFALASHMNTTMRRIEPVLARMREGGLVKFEVARPGEHDGLVWRRSKAGIERAKTIEMRQRARRR